jgi:hypothetical protein
MWVKWNGRSIVAGPQSEPPWITENRVRKPPPGWYLLDDSAQRTSPAQEQVVSLDAGMVVIRYEGDPDPGHAPATLDQVRQVWTDILQLPVAADDGKVFQFDRDSRELMAGAIAGLEAVGGTVCWRLLDNSEVECDAAQLQDYYQQLVRNRALRGLAVDAEYLAFKRGATVVELEAWREKYS